MKNLFSFSLVIFVAVLSGAVVLTGDLCQAFYSNLDTADLLKPGEYELGLEPQYIFTDFPGANVIAHLNMGGTENSNYRFLLGSGSTAFQAGAFYKVVPIPDYQNQPGIGGYGGIIVGVENGQSTVSLRIHPEISKRFVTLSSGVFTPYFALPFGVLFYDGTPYYPIQVAIGTKWMPQSLKHMSFWGELGLNLNSAFSYVSLGLTVPFDSWENIRFD